MARANEGDTIRLYGYSGTFVVVGVYSKPLGEFVGVTRSRNGGRELFQQHESSIVEVNGEPKPLQSCPIAPPALDYSKSLVLSGWKRIAKLVWYISDGLDMLPMNRYTAQFEQQRLYRVGSDAHNGIELLSG